MVDRLTGESLNAMGVTSLDELRHLPTDKLSEALGAAPFPPSEKVIAVLVLTAVDGLHAATSDLARAAAATDEKTQTLVTAAWLTLAVAVLSLIAAVTAVIVSVA